ncbi:hypothetical protein EHQ47_19560 [Leptospira bourretii]|uniref:hypothetical protein n=1 Tax=Leptospira bourretii TaxID=2484962 RepID=UPI0010911756|nr:hypothetical protein [Leptospira bourretii]TGL17394.1 hypothetical protein EHQ47_19560 [Leptospira bourretii]
MKKILLILFLITLGNCDHKVSNKFEKFNGYYYFDGTLQRFKNHGFENGLNFKYMIFDQADSMISVVDVKNNNVIKYKVDMVDEDELRIKLNEYIYFNFTEDKRSDRVVQEINFYTKSKDPKNSFLDIGYKSGNVKSIEDARTQLDRYEKENKIFEENLPPGQE